MDPHTLDLLEFDKVRNLLADYAATSLGAELARRIEPSRDVHKVRADIALVSEMVEALMTNHAPPFGGVHDIRLLVRRAAIGTMLTAEQLLEVADTLTATGAFYRYRMRLDGQLASLEDRVQHEIKKLLRDPQLRAILRYPNATVNGDHYVLPVAANHRQKIQGVVHRTSSTA